MLVTGLSTCLYVVSRPGKGGTKGYMIYVAAGFVSREVLEVQKSFTISCSLR
jgi:hypothetical protein